MGKSERVTFLIVDDDDVAVLGMKRAIRKLNLYNPIQIARNGEEALDVLRGNDARPLPRPYIVTLDLNMPRMGGLEFLSEIRSDKSLQDAIIFVVTTSDAPADITSAYSRNIAGYIVKEDTFQTLRRSLELLRQYTEVVRLPDDTFNGAQELRFSSPVH